MAESGQEFRGENWLKLLRMGFGRRVCGGHLLGFEFLPSFGDYPDLFLEKTPLPFINLGTVSWVTGGSVTLLPLSPSHNIGPGMDLCPKDSQGTHITSAGAVRREERSLSLWA